MSICATAYNFGFLCLSFFLWLWGFFLVGRLLTLRGREEKKSRKKKKKKKKKRERIKKKKKEVQEARMFFSLLATVSRRNISKKAFFQWLGDKKDVDVELMKRIWPSSPKEVKISEEEHERRVITAKHWCRYRKQQAFLQKKRNENVRMLVAKASKTLQKDYPLLFEEASKLPETEKPTEMTPPSYTPPIPGFYHGKREL